MKSAILLLNMGGPNRLEEVRTFMENMFDDKHILPVNSFLRRFIKKRIVKKRLRESEENYARLGGRSPLTDITRSLASKIEKMSRIPVFPAMRYVPPYADEALNICEKKGIGRVILFPMYPHYSTTTTLSSYEDIVDRLSREKYSPELVLAEPYYNDPDYIEIQCSRIEKAVADKNASEFMLIFSAHGLPVRIVESGDPYRSHIEENCSLIKKRLQEKGISFRDAKLAYQSRVGSGAWLEPDLSSLLRRPECLKVLIFPISFTVDNSETLFELDMEYREIAEKIGYEEYCVAECPNDGEDFARFVSEKAAVL